MFAWGAWHLDLDWSGSNCLLLTFTIFSGMALFAGLMVFQATLSIWTVESLEIMNILTYGGVQTAQYPLDIYEDWFRKVFTFIVPLACVSYFPVVALMGKPDPLGTSFLFQVTSPLLGFVFLGLSLGFFQFGCEAISVYQELGLDGHNPQW